MRISRDEYNQRQRNRKATPEFKEYRRAYDQREDVKERARLRRQTEAFREKRRAYQRKYRQTAHWKAYRRLYRSTPEAKDQRRNQLLLKQFGIDLSTYNDMLSKQGGTCAICKQPETFVHRGVLVSLAVDHCHKTGKVRGLLCRSCNQGIGHFKDSIQSLENAKLYLTQYGI